MMQNKKILGITGGSGSGKTTVSHILRELGIYVIDGDWVARLIVAPGSPCLKELTDFFGDRILQRDGSLDRKQLGAMVFSDPAQLKQLNRITHRYITEWILWDLQKQKGPLCVIDAAALLESGLAERCDWILSVLAERQLRKERILKRDRLTVEEAQRRISAQQPDEFYIEKSDFIIYNNGNEATLRQQVEQVLKKIEGDR